MSLKRSARRQIGLFVLLFVFLPVMLRSFATENFRIFIFLLPLFFRPFPLVLLEMSLSPICKSMEAVDSQLANLGGDLRMTLKSFKLSLGILRVQLPPKVENSYFTFLSFVGIHV